VDPDGRPHLVPLTFALGSRARGAGSGPEDHIYSAVDAKPKSSTDLRRLRNIRVNPRVAVLADHYEDDWDGLWWVRADGQAAILDDPAAMAPALALLGGHLLGARQPLLQPRHRGGVARARVRVAAAELQRARPHLDLPARLRVHTVLLLHWPDGGRAPRRR